MGACCGKKIAAEPRQNTGDYDQSDNSFDQYRNEENISFNNNRDVPKPSNHKLVGKDVSFIQLPPADSLKLDLSELPRPESIDVSHIDPTESRRNLQLFIASQNQYDQLMHSDENRALTEIHDLILDEFEKSIKGKEQIVFSEWNPEQTTDLVEFSKDVLVGFAFINLIRIRPSYLCNKIFSLYKERFVFLKGDQYLLNGFSFKLQFKGGPHQLDTMIQTICETKQQKLLNWSRKLYFESQKTTLMLKQFHVMPKNDTESQLFCLKGGSRSGFESIFVALLLDLDFLHRICYQKTTECGINITTHDQYNHIVCLNLNKFD